MVLVCISQLTANDVPLFSRPYLPHVSSLVKWVFSPSFNCLFIIHFFAFLLFIEL